MYRTILLFAALLVFVPIATQAVTSMDVVNQISQTSIQNYMYSMPTYYGDNRGFNVSLVNGVYQHGVDHDPMRDLLFTYIRRSGWTTFVDPIYIVDTSGNITNGANVIAIKQGTVTPDKIYFVGAHYDSKNNPGANDNASGCAGLLEMARVFSQYTFDSTIIFAFFDGEETTVYGNDGITYRRVGSIHYVNKYTDVVSRTQQMVSFDMVAHADGSNRGRLETGYPQNTALNNAIINALTTYGGLGYSTNNSMNYSDHVSFANLGVPALMLIEYGWGSSDPYYHTSSDAVDNPNNISWPYLTKMVKTMAGYLCDAAGLNGIAPGYAKASESASLSAQANATGDLGQYLRGLIK